MAAAGLTVWKENLLWQLKSRNRKQSHPFEGLIQSHSKLFENATVLKSKNVQLTLETEKLKEENLGLQIKAESGGASGGATGDKNSNLEHKLYKLQEELTGLHRRRSENAQQIIDLNTALQEKEKELQGRDARLSDASATELALRSAIKNLEHTIMELEATNQMLKDEHTALQLAFTALEEKYRKAQEDNRELVERWMDQKAKDADKLNAENDHVLRRRQDKLRKDLAEAAKENITILKEEDVGVYVKGVTPICLQASLPEKAQHKYDAHEGEVNAIRWSPSGSMFATGGTDRKIKLWEVIAGKCESKGFLTGSNQGITSLDFDLEETLILGASNDFASRVWSLADQRLRHTLTGHSGKVMAAKFLGDSSKVVSGSHDRTLKIWDLHSRACIKTIFAGSSCNDLVTLHGTNVVSGHFDKRVRFWDSRSDSSTNEILLQGRLTSLDLSPDRTTLLCSTRDDTLKVIDLRMNQVSKTLYADDFKVGCDWARAIFSPDGSYALAGSNDGALYIWNLAKSKVEKVLKEHNHSVISCAWHPVGSYVLSGERQKKVVLWSDI